MRYSDRESIGPSQIVPLIKDEAPVDRHRRRLEAAIAGTAQAQEVCKAAGIILHVYNDGHHWVFQYHSQRAEWWPSRAKMVFQRQWENGKHTHDWTQVVSVLRKRWNLEEVAT